MVSTSAHGYLAPTAESFRSLALHLQHDETITVCILCRAPLKPGTWENRARRLYEHRMLKDMIRRISVAKRIALPNRVATRRFDWSVSGPLKKKQDDLLDQLLHVWNFPFKSRSRRRLTRLYVHRDLPDPDIAPGIRENGEQGGMLVVRLI